VQVINNVRLVMPSAAENGGIRRLQPFSSSTLANNNRVSIA